MGKAVNIEPSDLVEMIADRLLEYDREDLARFWERNFDHDPKVEVDEDGDGLIAFYEE
jgi:hypothetical protein